MNYDIKVGFSRVNVNPPLNIKIRGYLIDRFNEGFLDDLEVNALAVNKDDKTVVLVAVDNCGIVKDIIKEIKDKVCKLTKLDEQAIFIHATHIHTGPFLKVNENSREIEIKYTDFLGDRIADACKMAINDLKPAKMGYAFSKAEKVAFNRRYLMKDGTTRTNPGVNNPDIVKSLGLLDESVNVLRFTREDGENFVVVNFGNHPDCIGGNKISADWPGFTRRIFEKAIDNSKCIVFNGAQGDINHVNVAPKGGDFNGMFMDFDDVSRGYSHSRHIGNVMAASAMVVYEKVNYVDVDKIDYKIEDVEIFFNKADESELEEAEYIFNMYKEGKADELPYKGMMLTTMIADARRKVNLKNYPDSTNLPFSAIRIGNVAFAGLPGEPFAGIGIGLKKTEGYDMVLPCCCTNSYQGYYPMKDSYQEGGYEANGTSFKEGTAERFIEYGSKILKSLK